MAENLTREYLAERDLRIFQMRKGGLSIPEIAKRLQTTNKIISTAISRQLEKMNQEALLSYPEVLRMELERLDTLQAALWPLTQIRRTTLPNGEEVTLEPDIKATQQVLSIMDRRSKLLGMDRIHLDIQTTQQETIRHTLNAENTNTIDHNDPEIEGRQLLQLMAESGVIPKTLLQALTPTETNPDPNIETAEIIQENTP